MPANNPPYTGAITSPIANQYPASGVAMDAIGQDLVKMPFSIFQVSSQSNGATSVQQQTAMYDNTDGSMTGWNCSVPNSAGDSLILSFPFYGPLFGIRVRYGASPPTNFCVSVDGEIVEFFLPNQWLINQQLASGLNNEVCVITHPHLIDLFGNGQHTAQIMFAANQSALLTGFVVQRGKFNNAPTPVPVSMPSTQVQVTTAPALVAPYIAAIGSSSRPMNYITGLVWTNISASTQTLTLQDGSANVLMSVSMLPGTNFSLNSEYFPLGPSAMYHVASANSAIIMVGFGRNIP